MKKAKILALTLIAVVMSIALVLSASASTMTVAQLAAQLNETAAQISTPELALSVEADGNIIVNIFIYDIPGFDTNMAEMMLDAMDTMGDVVNVLITGHRALAPSVAGIRWEIRNVSGDVLATASFTDGGGTTPPPASEAPAESAPAAPESAAPAPAPTRPTPNPGTGVIIPVAALATFAIGGTGLVIFKKRK